MAAAPQAVKNAKASEALATAAPKKGGKGTNNCSSSGGSTSSGLSSGSIC